MTYLKKRKDTYRINAYNKITAKLRKYDDILMRKDIMQIFDISGVTATKYKKMFGITRNYYTKNDVMEILDHICNTSHTKTVDLCME